MTSIYILWTLRFVYEKFPDKAAAAAAYITMQKQLWHSVVYKIFCIRVDPNPKP